MSLSNNLNDALAMSLPHNEAVTIISKNDCLPINFQKESFANEISYSPNKHIGTKFPFKKIACSSNKFPNGKEYNKFTSSKKFMITEFKNSGDVLIQSVQGSSSGNPEKSAIVKYLKAFPFQSLKNDESHFPLKITEVAKNVNATEMAKKARKANMINGLMDTVKNLHKPSELKLTENISETVMRFPESTHKTQKDYKSTKFPILSKLFGNNGKFSIELTNEAKIVNIVHQSRFDEHSAMNSYLPPIALEECAPNVQKFPIIKKQFFKFPISREERVINAKLMTIRGKTNVEIIEIHKESSDEYIKCMNEGEYNLDKAMQPIHGHALNLNAQNDRKCAKVTETEVGETEDTVKKIKHQQAENFNDAFKMTIDAMNLLKYKNAKNTTNNEMCEQNRKLLPEIFVRDEQNMTKAKTPQTTITTTTTTPTLSKNLANQEQQSTYSTEHSFNTNEPNTNNNGECRQPDNNNYNNHQQQSLPKQSETQHTNPKRSDVREPSSGLAEEQLIASHDSGSTSIQTTPPTFAAVTPAAATVSTNVGVGIGVASHASVASLALSAPATYDERGAEPNIELSANSKDISYGDDDDYVYVASDDVNDYVYESECADILTDVIDLIEETTTAIIITGNLLADACEKSEDGVPEVNVTVTGDMTVTKATEHSQAGDVCAEREQKLLNKTSSVVDELDEMKFEMRKVKGTLPASIAGNTARTSDINLGGSSTRDIGRVHDTITPTRTTAPSAEVGMHRGSYGTPRLNEIASKRGSLTRMHDSNTSSSSAVGNRITPLSPTTEAATPIRLSGVSSLDLRSLSSQESLESVLPERTRLRRQKRMRSQESVEEKPEDVIERLNKLKARISGALSEVKSVIKQYSTESEAEAANEITKEKPSAPIGGSELKSSEKGAGASDEVAPVQFRFVRKVRRRSVFKEEDEYTVEQESLKNEEALAVEKETNEEPKEKQNLEIEQKTEKAKEEEALGEIKEKSKQTGPIINENEPKPEDIKENGDLKNENKQTNLAKPSDELKKENNKAAESAASSLTDFIEMTIEEPKEHVKTKLEFLHKVAQELYKKPGTKTTTSNENIEKKSIKNEENTKPTELAEPPVADATQTLATVAEVTAKEKTTNSTNVASLPPAHPIPEETTKPKKKIVVHKVKTTTKPRRASIAAVEGSKIEPPVQSTLPLSIKAQRRPSDSETIVKKKTNKLTTSVVNGDELPKVKSVSKVKRASIKGGATAPTLTTSIEPATTNQEQDKIQLKVKEGIEQATTTSTTPATQKSVAKSEDNKIEDRDKNANNSNKDAGDVPSQAKATTLVTEAQPKQLKIDGDRRVDDDVAASLNDKAPQDNANVASTNETTKATLAASKSDADAASASPLSASKVNGQIERISDKLAELVGETVVVASVNCKSVQDTKKDNATLTTIITQPSQESQNDESDSKKLIYQQADTKIPTQSINEVNKQQRVSSDSKQAEQQVVSQINESTAAVAIDIDAAASKSGAVEPQIATESLSACDAITLAEIATKEEATKVDATAAATTSVATHTDVETSKQLATTTEESIVKETEAKTSANGMPELKVSAGPVQPVKLGIDGATSEQVPFDVPATHTDDAFHAQKKKVIVKKLVRKNSIDRVKEKNENAAKLNSLLKDKHKISNMTAVLDKNAPPKKLTPKESKAKEVAQNEDVKSEEPLAETTEIEVVAPDAEAEVEPPAPAPKKPRKIKKKVIIKRQKRRLSISDTFFMQPEEEPKVPEIEIIEKAIAYVTDDEADDNETENSKDETDKPLKTCLHIREYKVGELVLYAERFRKTQVKWKRGRVLERITSISYKLEIDGKEVPAHVSYIKKWSGRKVNFGIKEYLEIDYEQVAEEERRARSYSIWNMV